MFFKTYLIIFLVKLILCQDENEVNYYINLIETTEKEAFQYVLPTSASNYKSESDKAKNYGKFDFVVIGAGAAGSVMASRLSEKEDWSVLVLEAGDFGNNFTDIPIMLYPTQFTQYNWGFTSTPQKTACLGMVNNICTYPRGRGVGGSTLINGLVYSRGHSTDFDNWAGLVNDNRWSYKNVLPFFKKSENYVHRDPEAPVEPQYHGEGGLLNVEYHLPRSPQVNAWFEANKEMGYEIVDYNANRIGASPAQVNTKNGRRFDNGKAFIRPFLNRKNLKVLTNSYVTKIRICKATQRAYAVEFTYNNKQYVVEAKNEVILSAGALQSPQLLMLSGIGPKKHLESRGIEVVQDLEVGSTLRDHATFYGAIFQTNYSIPNMTLREEVEDFLKGVGVLASPAQNQGVGFYPSSYSKSDVPDIEIMFIPADAHSPFLQRSYQYTNETYDALWGHNNPNKTFIAYIVGLHMKSIGTIRLKSKNPYDYPLIDSNFLSDSENHDINVLYEGLQLLLNMTKTKAFQKLNPVITRPLKACSKFEYLSKDYWYCALRQASVNLYHPVSTCPMAKDRSQGVVDSHARVFGIKNLRVVDGSVFPFTLAGHPNAPIVMVAELISSLIKEGY